MFPKTLVGPDDQRVTFIELFFDLVFVFAVTQVVALVHDDGIGWASVGRALLVFWLVWWGWTQFTWALNAADTTHYLVEFGTLFAAGIAFFMAVSLPHAYDGRELWFGLTYVGVRIVGLGIYAAVAWENPLQRAAVRSFAVASVAGMVAVAAGAAIGGNLQYWFWGLAIFLDVLAAAVGGQAEGWNLHTEHFVERHGLFVIIALGESLIVTAGSLTNSDWTAALVLSALLVVLVTFAFWWSYFPAAKPHLEDGLARLTGAAHSTTARDVFSLLHFPMLFGIIAFAAAVEEILAHPQSPLPAGGRYLLAASLLLFVGGMSLASWRASHLLPARMALISITAALVALVTGLDAVISLAVAFAGLVITLVVEHLTEAPHEEAPEAQLDVS
jgi:low temperature requirement protein LtrA